MLRSIEERDVDALREILGDPEVMRFVGDAAPLTPDQFVEWIERARLSTTIPRLEILAVELVSTGELIGYCGIEIGEDTDKPELLYARAQQHWRKGLAFEAVGAVAGSLGRSHATLVATAGISNDPSIRILGKLGFVRTHAAVDVRGLPTAFFKRPRPSNQYWAIDEVPTEFATLDGAK